MIPVDEKNKKIDLLGINFSPLPKDELLDEIKRFVEQKERRIILSGNIFSFNLAYENEWLQRFFNRDDVIVRLDGAGIRMGAKILGHETPERMTWADFAWDLGAYCEENKLSMFLLGAKPGVTPKAAENLVEKYPNLKIVGTHHGYFAKDNEENMTVIEEINGLKPDIVILGFGMPVQEEWLSKNWDKLTVPVVMTGGAVFDYISGNQKRAPKWMTDYGFEWLGRLLIEPRRLWKRYVIGNPIFFFRVLRQLV